MGFFCVHNGKLYKFDMSLPIFTPFLTKNIEILDFKFYVYIMFNFIIFI